MYVGNSLLEIWKYISKQGKMFSHHRQGTAHGSLIRWLTDTIVIMALSCKIYSLYIFFFSRIWYFSSLRMRRLAFNHLIKRTMVQQGAIWRDMVLSESELIACRHNWSILSIYVSIQFPRENAWFYYMGRKNPTKELSYEKSRA